MVRMCSDRPRRRSGRFVSLNGPTSRRNPLLVPSIKPTREKSSTSRKISKSSGTVEDVKPTPLSVPVPPPMKSTRGKNNPSRKKSKCVTVSNVKSTTPLSVPPPMKAKVGNRKRLESDTVSDRMFRAKPPTLSWSRGENSKFDDDTTRQQGHQFPDEMMVQEDGDLGDIRKARIKAKHSPGEFRAYVNIYTGDHNDECEVCDEPGDLVCCDFCNTVWHLKCLDFVNEVFEPTEKELWTCPLCTRDLVARHEASHLKRRIRAIEESTAEALKSGGNFLGAFYGVKAISSTEWQAKVTQVKPAFDLGTFSTAEAAARAHDFKAHCLVGDAAVCNFHMDDAIDPEVRWEDRVYEQWLGGKLLDDGSPPNKVTGRGEMEAEWTAIPGICKTFDGWRAELKYGNRKVHLGFFPDIRRASAAYQRANAFYFGGSIGGIGPSTISSTVPNDENPLLDTLATAPYSPISNGSLSENGENTQGGSQKEKDNDENLETSLVSDCTSQPVDQPPIKRRIVQIIGMEAVKELDKLKELMSDEELKLFNRRERSMHGLYCEPVIGPLHQVDLESIPPCMDSGKERGVSYNDDMLPCGGGPEELFVKIWDPEKGSTPEIIRFLESKPPFQALCAMYTLNEVDYHVDTAEKSFSCAVEHSGQRYTLPDPPATHTFEETTKETSNHYENKVGPSSCSHQPLSCIRCHIGNTDEVEKRGGTSATQEGKLGEGNNSYVERNENDGPRIRQTHSSTLSSHESRVKRLSTHVKSEMNEEENSLDGAKEEVSDNSAIAKAGNTAADAATDSQGLRLHDVRKALLCFRRRGRDLHAVTTELGWPATTTVSFYYNFWKKSPVYQWWKATRRRVSAVVTRTGIMLQNGLSKSHNDAIALRWRGSRLRTLMGQSK